MSCTCHGLGMVEVKYPYTLPETQQFVKLYEDEEYNELARLPLLIYAISPDSVTCERGFSIMNYIKNQYRSRLTQNKLNACMALAMDERSVEDFPNSKLK